MKTALITGASKGIGKATAILFAERGFNVVINYNESKLNAESLERELTEKGFKAVAIKADVSNEAEVKAMYGEIEKRFGGVDVLVNNAGISLFSQVNYTDKEVFNKVMAVNFNGTHYVTQAVLPYMISKKRGAIVNVSSIWGKVGASCEAVYSASKAAVIGYTKAIAKELGPSNVKVNAVCPGVINTEMNARLSKEELLCLEKEIPLERIGEPCEVAEAIYFLATATYITGQVLTVDGGFIE